MQVKEKTKRKVKRNVRSLTAQNYKTSTPLVGTQEWRSDYMDKLFQAEEYVLNEEKEGRENADGDTASNYSSDERSEKISRNQFVSPYDEESLLGDSKVSEKVKKRIARENSALSQQIFKKYHELKLEGIDKEMTEEDKAQITQNHQGAVFK